LIGCLAHVRIGLKVDVDTLRGTQQGVPALLRLLDEFNVCATFLFSLGPDHTGRALKRIFRPGFLAKVSRTSVTSHYGFKTLLYGTLLPGPQIARRAGAVMRSVAAAGHEVGIHCYDHVKWQDYVSRKDANWTKHEIKKAFETFEDVFNFVAKVHGAAGWQINPHVLKYEAELGLEYASDTRGSQAFLPVMQGISSTCPQLPTTLPTLDELIGREGITEANVHESVHAASQRALPNGHVYTLHAELEGMKLLSTLRQLLQCWQADGFTLGTTRDIFETLDVPTLPRHEVVWGEVEGRSGYLAVQGRAAV
jgi:undecaprenyl phosphate-alpha-L-ara4FN deformylase